MSHPKHLFDQAMKRAMAKQQNTTKAEPVKAEPVKAEAPKLSAAEIQEYVEKIKALVAVQSEPEAKEEDPTTRIIKQKLQARGIQPNG